MESVRLVAVERGVNPALGIVIVAGKVCIYDRQQELLESRQMVSTLDDVATWVTLGRYRWADFTLQIGDRFHLDDDASICVGEERHPRIRPEQTSPGRVSQASLALFYHFLRLVHRQNPQTLAEIDTSYQSGQLRAEVGGIVKERRVGWLSAFDETLIVRARLEGLIFVTRWLQRIITGDQTHKEDRIYHMFSRLFLLERHKYLDLDTLEDRYAIEAVMPRSTGA